MTKYFFYLVSFLALLLFFGCTGSNYDVLRHAESGAGLEVDLDSNDDIDVAFGGTNASTAAAARTNLGLVIGTDVLAPTGNGSGLTAVDAATGDSATGFFDAGTIEHERGGLETDVSAYSGLLGVSGGATSEVDTAAELENIISDAGALFSDLIELTSVAALQALIDVEIGVDVQAYDSNLDTWSDPTAYRVIYSGAAGAATEQAFGTANYVWISGGPGAAPSWGLLDENSLATTLNLSGKTLTLPPISGELTGLTPPRTLSNCEGQHDGAGDASTLSDSGESFPTDQYIGMTLYNTTDGSSCKVTDNDGTTMTCTLSGGTDNDWDAADAWAVAPGSYQGGTVFYITSATTVLWPSTAGYAAGFYSTGGNVIKVDPQSGSMSINLNTGSGITDCGAGDEIDSSGTAGDLIWLHNQSATEAWTHGRAGTWADGGAS